MPRKMHNAYFKYISDINAVERLSQLLTGKIYFSSANNFNDPFEFSACAIERSPLTKIQAVKHGNRKKQKHLTRKQKIKTRRDSRASINLNTHKTVQDRWISEFGIYCVSKNPTNLLMWSHYSNCHKGICIGFDANCSIFRQARKVSYTRTLPKLSQNDSADDLLEKIVFTKSEDWGYEEEFRIVSRPIREGEKRFYKSQIKLSSTVEDEVADLLAKNGGPGLHEFDKNSIFVIYIGVNSSADFESKIREMAGAHEIHVERLKKDPTSFSLY